MSMHSKRIRLKVASRDKKWRVEWVSKEDMRCGVKFLSTDSGCSSLFTGRCVNKMACKIDSVKQSEG